MYRLPTTDYRLAWALTAVGTGCSLVLPCKPGSSVSLANLATCVSWPLQPIFKSAVSVLIHLPQLLPFLFGHLTACRHRNVCYRPQCQQHLGWHSSLWQLLHFQVFLQHPCAVSPPLCSTRMSCQLSVVRSYYCILCITVECFASCLLLGTHALLFPFPLSHVYSFSLAEAAKAKVSIDTATLKNAMDEASCFLTAIRCRISVSPNIWGG